MDDLIAFLKARLDENEAAARESYYEGQRWITKEEGVYRWPEDELVHSADRKADARHIARHDPARVLREVAAMRAIVRLYEKQVAKEFVNAMEEDRTWTLWPVIAHLATIWGDHPDYRSEWAPAVAQT